MQITDQTRKILADEKGEVKDHYLTLTSADASNPDVAICAAIRWLFHKRETAKLFLGLERLKLKMGMWIGEQIWSHKILSSFYDNNQLPTRKDWHLTLR